MQNLTTFESTPIETEDLPEPSQNTKLLIEAFKAYEPKLKTSIRIFLYRLGVADTSSNIELELEDILHNTIETALRNADEFDFSDPNAAPLAWLKQIALNHVRNLKRRQKRTVSVHEAVPARNEEGEARNEAELFDKLRHPPMNTAPATMPVLKELLPLIPIQYHEGLLYSIRDGLSPAEVAVHLGVSPGAAYTKLSRARTHLKKAYKAWKARQLL